MSSSKVVFKDPVLPMILSGLTMNFILYENDYGLAIARLCIAVSTWRSHDFELKQKALPK